MPRKMPERLQAEDAVDVPAGGIAGQVEAPTDLVHSLVRGEPATGPDEAFGQRADDAVRERRLEFLLA
jgi:hypothetical protein